MRRPLSIRWWRLPWWLPGLAMAAWIALAPSTSFAQQTLQEIVVTAGLRDTSVAELPQSVTVLDQDTLRGAGVQQLQDVLSLIPNLSWASGSSRPRFFLMRGIGEVEQYQGAPNPSVGFLIDDIDFSGIGAPATLFDTRQVEVLRGPQGTVYGANALAGLINVRTEDPAKDFSLHGEATLGDFETRAAALALSDSFDDNHAGWRIAAQQYRSDGYRHNTYLQRDDTNGYNEGTLRGKFFWQITPALRADLALMDVDINNGYDAFSVDNSRTTLTNQPGRDAQQSLGTSLRLTGDAGAFGEVRSITSAANSHIVYSYDADWGNDPYWASCCDYSPYDYFQQDRRTRRSVAEDLRFIGDDAHQLFGHVNWVLGAYFLHLSESDALLNVYNDQFNGQGDSLLSSDYGSTDAALYGSLDSALGDRSSLTLGLRTQRRTAHYQDSDSADLSHPFPDENNTMLGGSLSWKWRTGQHSNLYTTLARGFKGGGFNIGQQISVDRRRYAPEYLWSLESGVTASSANGHLQGQSDVFYMRRQSMQVYSSCQLADNPVDYVFFTKNVSHGENYGLESQGLWQVTPRWQLSGSAGLLHTRYLGYDSVAVACPQTAPLPLDGRAQSFAPEYQFSAALSYSHPSGVFARLDGFATDGFYFAAGHDQVAQAYQLVNLRVGYQHSNWQVSVWSHNLLDQRYAIQGFYFGLVPPAFATQRFIQNGDPRTVGLTVRLDLDRDGGSQWK